MNLAGQSRRTTSMIGPRQKIVFGSANGREAAKCYFVELDVAGRTCATSATHGSKLVNSCVAYGFHHRLIKPCFDDPFLPQGSNDIEFFHLMTPACRSVDG